MSCGIGSAGVAGSAAAGANVRARLPLYHPAQWSRGPDVGATSLLLALLAASLLLALLDAGLLAAGCCLLAVLLGTCPLRDWAYQKIYPTLCYKPAIVLPNTLQVRFFSVSTGNKALRTELCCQSLVF